MFQNTKYKRGFTFIELIVSMFVVSIIMCSLLATYQNYRQVHRKFENDQRIHFLHFVTMLENELEYYEYQSVQQNQLWLHRRNDVSQKQIITIDRQRIVKRPGTQIMLYNVKLWQIEEIGQKIFIQVTFNNGQIYEAIIPLFHPKVRS